MDYLVINSSSRSQSKIFIDCTFGAGGYSKAILQQDPKATVIAIDRDPKVEKYVKELKQQYGDRFNFYQDTFSNYGAILDKHKIKSVDGICLDLGFSNIQIADTSRGFSFNSNSSISMEMGVGSLSTYNFINTATETDIADVIYVYGEEIFSRRIARAVVKYRSVKPIETSKELGDIIRSVCPKNGKKDSATKTFQAIRIHINKELHELDTALQNSLTYLSEGSRIAVVSFHSLEDRIVKNFFNKYSCSKQFTNYKPSDSNVDERLNILTKKPILPKDDEMRVNPPSTSAKLRVAEKLK